MPRGFAAKKITNRFRPSRFGLGHFANDAAASARSCSKQLFAYRSAVPDAARLSHTSREADALQQRTAKNIHQQHQRLTNWRGSASLRLRRGPALTAQSATSLRDFCGAMGWHVPAASAAGLWPIPYRFIHIYRSGHECAACAMLASVRPPGM